MSLPELLFVCKKSVREWTIIGKEKGERERKRKRNSLDLKVVILKVEDGTSTDSGTGILTTVKVDGISAIKVDERSLEVDVVGGLGLETVERLDIEGSDVQLGNHSVFFGGFRPGSDAVEPGGQKKKKKKKEGEGDGV